MVASKKDDAKKVEAHGTCGGPCVAGIAELLEEHRVALSSEFKMAFSSLEEKLTQTQATVEGYNQRIVSVESNANLLEERVCLLEERCTTLADGNARLAAKTADLESRSRRDNIRIIGLPESIEGPRLTTFFSDMLVELLGSQILPTPPELDRAHRTLVAKPPPGGKPRVVMVRFHHYQVRDLVVREARKQRGKLQYRGKPVLIFEDYTPEVLEQ